MKNENVSSQKPGKWGDPNLTIPYNNILNGIFEHDNILTGLFNMILSKKQSIIVFEHDHNLTCIITTLLTN